jgi:hypothetical protein
VTFTVTGQSAAGRFYRRIVALYREYSTNRDYVNPADNHDSKEELGGAKAFPSGCQIANLKWQM